MDNFPTFYSKTACCSLEVSQSPTTLLLSNLQILDVDVYAPCTSPGIVKSAFLLKCYSQPEVLLTELLGITCSKYYALHLGKPDAGNTQRTPASLPFYVFTANAHFRIGGVLAPQVLQSMGCFKISTCLIIFRFEFCSTRIPKSTEPREYSSTYGAAVLNNPALSHILSVLPLYCCLVYNMQIATYGKIFALSLVCHQTVYLSVMPGEILSGHRNCSAAS